MGSSSTPDIIPPDEAIAAAAVQANAAHPRSRGREGEIFRAKFA